MAIHYNRKIDSYFVEVGNHIIETTVTASGNTVKDWIGHTLYTHQHHLDHLIVGLDVEWCQSRYPGSKAKDPIAILQIAVGCRCLIFQLLHRDYIPVELYDFLEDSRFKFCGVGVAGDAEKLFKGYNIKIPQRQLVDLPLLAADKYDRPEMRWMGLQNLASQVTGIKLEKDKRITLSNWGLHILSKRQISYAALDAYASFEIGRTLIFRTRSTPITLYGCTLP